MHAVRLNTEVHNPGARRRALVLHGLGSDGPTTWRIADALAAAGHEVTVPDLRGHGRSPVAAHLGIDGYAADVALLGEGWDVVVGHSLGGAVLAVLCARAGFAERAVLLDPALRLPGGPARDELRTRMVAEVGGTLTDAALAAAQPRWDAADVRRKVLASQLVLPRTVAATFDDNDPWDVLEHAGQWRCPVHLVAADPDLGALLPPDQVVALTARDGVTAETISGAGHSVHRDDPDASVAAVLARLT